VALFDDGLKGPTGSILVILGVALAAPIVLPAVASVSRPLAKTLIRGYLTLADTVKEFTAEAQEQVSDLMAEVKAERTAATTEAAAAAKSPPSS
jgi:esterase/lipase